MPTTTIPGIDAIIAAAEAKGARVGAYAVGPNDLRYAHREREIFKSASCIKIAIMIELFRRIDAGELSLKQPYLLKQEDKVPGSGVLQELHAGIELTLRDVIMSAWMPSMRPYENSDLRNPYSAGLCVGDRPTPTSRRIWRRRLNLRQW